MDSQLVQYLKKFRDDSSHYTHTSQMLPTSGVYLINNENLRKFYDIYCSRLWELGDQFFSGLAERPNKYMPVLADIDIKIPLYEDMKYDTTQHLYTQENVLDIIKIYNQMLKALVQDIKPHHLTCFVLEKKSPYVSGTNLKNGFHLHWPFIYLSNSDQEVHLIPRIKAEMNNTDMFKHLDIENSGDAIDRNISSKHWLLYGSRKDVELQAYNLTRIYNYAYQEITLDQALEKNKIYDTFDNEVDMSEYPLEYYLPIILSVHPYARPIYKVKPGVDCVIKQHLTRAEQSGALYEQMSMPETIALVRKLMTMVDPKRTDHHDTWMEVGWTLYNITQGCLEGLDIWIQFSMNAKVRTHVDEARCVWEWNRMKPGSKTMGSLRYWAEHDNPEMYEQFCREQQEKRINESLKGGHSDLAKYLYDKYKNRFVCASIKENMWFYFDGHRWKETQHGNALYKKIDTDLIPRFIDESKKRMDQLQDPDSEPGLTGRARSFLKTIEHLKTANFRDNVMKICKHDFYDPDFLEKLDADPTLLGFNNGVLDLKTCTFRTGEPSDFISKTCGYDFKEFKSNEDPEIIEVMQFWMKILPDADVRDSFLDFCGKLLRGGNDDQQFLILTGVGANGKTMAVDLISQALGKYAVKFPTTLLTGKEASSSAATPELMRAKNCRFADVSEPEGSVPINVGIMKRITGMEMIYGRDMYKGGDEFRPTFKLAYICNKLPKLPQDDNGTWRRILLYNFKSRFPAYDMEVPPTWQEQCEKRIFLRDKNMISKIPSMRQAMMWIMLECFKRVMKRKTQPRLPQEVTSAIDQYREQNDYYLQFIKETLKKDENASISFNDYYAMFKKWYEETFNSRVPNKNECKIEMQNKSGWGELSSDGRWVGWRVRNLQDDIDEGKVKAVDKN